MRRTGRECRINPIPWLLCLTQWAPTSAGSQRQLSKSGFECQLSFQESNPKKSSRNRNTRINHHHFTIPFVMPCLYTASSHHPLVMPCFDTASSGVLQHNLITGVHPARSPPGFPLEFIPPKGGTGMTRTGQECRINPIPSLLCLTQWAPTPAGSQRQLSKSGFEWQLSFQESNPKKSSRNRNTRINHHLFTIPFVMPRLHTASSHHPFVMPCFDTASSHNPLVMPCFDTASSDALQRDLYCRSTSRADYIWIPMYTNVTPLRKFSPVIGGGKRFCRASGQAAGTYKIVRRRESTGR